MENKNSWQQDCISTEMRMNSIRGDRYKILMERERLIYQQMGMHYRKYYTLEALARKVRKQIRREAFRFLITWIKKC